MSNGARRMTTKIIGLHFISYNFYIKDTDNVTFVVCWIGWEFCDMIIYLAMLSVISRLNEHYEKVLDHDNHTAS